MATWTRPDGLVVEVDQNCTTKNQLMAYLDEIICGKCHKKYNQITEKHCYNCHSTFHCNHSYCPNCGKSL